MTSSVKATAHCASTKHVQLRVMQSATFPNSDTVLEVHYLEDGESKEVVVYDDRYVITRELEK